VAVEVKSILNKMLKSKKGISPILATLLLIVIAVAAVIVTYAWVMTFTTTQTQQASAILTEENVRFYNKTTTKRDGLQVTLRNIGSADAKIVRLYLGNSATNLTDITTSYTDLSTGKAVPAGGALTISVTWANPLGSVWVPSTTYYFKVAPETGATFQFSEKSPA
jgi:flagellin-like protein